nr:MAG TPA: major capsid protein [Caudoviricetes sp.]DAW56054.1 MAG TPA: major capsid protein [Caudoviricetes sp.]DAX20021.1 MAG TPA: major capsid protein [Caudoviricetes sp.]
MKPQNYDFAGWVTKNDLKCSDGVTIRHGAFSGLSGEKVPLVWQHSYSQPGDTIGYILLHSNDQGVYGYGYLNETERGQDAKELLRHGDVNQMSIGARKIQKSGQDVIHGEIYEVSLVLKGANPGAVIEEVLTHGDGQVGDEIFITTGLTQDLLKHSNSEEKQMATIGEVIDTLTEDQAEVVTNMLENGVESLTPQDAEVIETLSDEQAMAINIIQSVAGEIEEDELANSSLDDFEPVDDEDEEVEELEESEDESEEESNEEADTDEEEIEHSGVDMKQNHFNQNGIEEQDTLTHAAQLADVAVREAAALGTGSIKAALAGVDSSGEFLQHGISNIDILFPAAQLQKGIQAYNPNAKNVETILNKFSAVSSPNVKNIYADLTEEQARARGYIKGNEKLNQRLISLYYRTTTPQTVIHKTAIDRDDVIDIRENGIDAVSFLKQVQSIKFKEELVRAAIFGDGREAIVSGKPNKEKINEEHIRPITKDDDFFTIKLTSQNWMSVVDDVIKTLPGYQGSGSPSLIINPFDLSKLKTLKDKNGRYLYGASSDGNRLATNSDLASYFGCSEVIEFRDMPQGKFLIGNLNDYVFGQSQGGQVVTFDDFDIDFNQMKYLMEARLSGAIMIPRAFIFVTVTDAEATNEDMLKFRKDALKTKPNWVEKQDKPGDKYLSKHSDADEAASPASGNPGSTGRTGG